MTILVMMYVFYDKNGDIKAIAPSVDNFSDPACSVATFPLSEVEGFLSGKKSTFSYQVQKLTTFAGVKFSITRKVVEVDYARTLDNYLTEIGSYKRDETIISLVNQKSHKVILVEITPEFKDMYTHDSDDGTNLVDDFIKLGRISIHITKKHNPYHLLFTFSFTTQELLSKGQLYFNYEGEYENTSAYTKKLIDGYGYKEKA